MKNHTMKNNASNPSIIQALQAHAQQLLPTVTQVLIALKYSEIAHQRLAQQNTETRHPNTHCYQGLTRATHPQFGNVMIKWQLTSHNSDFPFDLNHEVAILKALDSLLKTQSNAMTIAPSLLAYHNVEVQDLGACQQLTALVMPHYPNGNLTAQQYGALTTKQKHHFIVQAAYLIANLHHTGWLHNDIKPSNLLLADMPTDSVDNSSRVPDLLLTDFALAERLDKPRKVSAAGTPAYLAPERWHGQGATVQSDIYAFGIMMVEILMGERPFKIPTHSRDPMRDWATQHCQQPVPKLPSEYSRYQFIVDGALAKRVERRYKRMEAVLVDLAGL
ncbi:protein kinase domain-containing protein [Psychrobacter namhaensis]|uniref:protein kinase domain-containing protein n=1 Tax=Psychrobacter namhaensis TaxID=292734 RepID=UPI001D114451|nr:protein kinase [Psychrobacter namhaensis]